MKRIGTSFSRIDARQTFKRRRALHLSESFIQLSRSVPVMTISGLIDRLNKLTAAEIEPPLEDNKHYMAGKCTDPNGEPGGEPHQIIDPHQRYR